ncbi:MAG: hypothetical protein ABMB14_11045 [Myxococcota bacterium]
MDRFVLRIRAAYWGDCYDPSEALNDILNVHVRKGLGLSVWRYESDEEREVCACIMVERRQDAASGNLQVVEVEGTVLREAGFAPSHTPDRADSSHVDARRLHHDVEGLDESRAAILRDLLHARGRLRIYRKADLWPLLERELTKFEDEATREALRLSVAQAKAKRSP